MAAQPKPDRCHVCGTVACEVICHVCKEPREWYAKLTGLFTNDDGDTNDEA
jgi:hypothetical protein